ncbi:MAG TPA: hypothetical protein VHM19_00955 [Polyangiales bacterium]|nr:hypothetical protein [Polyangiales bacterium]
MAVGLALFALACVWLGRGAFYVGPSDWDDMLYCDYAATGGAHFELRNRYVHVWGLRLFDLLFGTRLSAATAYSTTLVIGLGWLAFFTARRVAGELCGFLAMALMLLFPPVLRYISTPHVDLTLAFWVLAAILGLVTALERQVTRRYSLPAAIRGMATFFALESKETALPLIGILPYLIVLRSKQRKLHLASWAAGLAVGFGVLLVLDALFTQPGQPWSSNPLRYFGARPASEPRLGMQRPERSDKFMKRDFGSELMDTPFWAFTFFGAAGLARRFRTSLVLEALGLWMFAAIALTAVVAFRSWDIQIYDRYLIGPGATLVIGSAVWLVELARRPRGQELENALWLVPLIAAALLVAVPYLVASYDGELPQRGARALFFVLPVLLFLLFFTPWLSAARHLPLACAGIALAISLYASVMTGLAHARQEHDEMAPWYALVAKADRANASIAVWDADQYPERRLLWRVRTLSARARDSVKVRTIDAPQKLAEHEWLLTRGCRRGDLTKLGFVQVVAGACSDRGHEWSVYRSR